MEVGGLQESTRDEAVLEYLCTRTLFGLLQSMLLSPHFYLQA